MKLVHVRNTKNENNNQKTIKMMHRKINEKSLTFAARHPPTYSY